MKVRVAWECPGCGHRHLWRWDEWDVTPGKIHMHCDACGSDTRMTLAQIGRSVWAAIWEGVR